MRTEASRRRCLAAAAVAALACASLPATGRAAAGGNLPYSKSTAITSFNLDWNSLQRKAPGSDNWSNTWAGDGSVYASFGDGTGFGQGRVSLGFARLAGNSARTLKGRQPARHGAQRMLRRAGPRPNALRLVSPGSGAVNYKEARLYAAPLGTNAWRRAGWAFTKDDRGRIILPTFLRREGLGQGVGYVYVYAPRYAPNQANRLSLQRTPGRGGEIALLRAPRGSDLMRRDSWQFFAGLDQSGQPRWSGDAHQLQPVITDQNGVGWTVSATYDPRWGVSWSRRSTAPPSAATSPCSRRRTSTGRGAPRRIRPCRIRSAASTRRRSTTRCCRTPFRGINSRSPSPARAGRTRCC